jgi:hypothetical protein
MSYYFSFPFKQQTAVARVFVKKDGTDEVQLAYYKSGLAEVVWRTKSPGYGFEVYTMIAASADEYTRTANRRYHDDAVRLAAKTAVS